MSDKKASINIKPWLVTKQEEIEAVCNSYLGTEVSRVFIVDDTNRRKAKAWDELLRMVDYGKC